MNDPIELIEYQSTSVSLALSDVDWFIDQGRGRFTLAPIRGSAEWLLSPNSTVGVVVLPSGRRVHCHPKAPVRNVFFMLATALELRSPFMDQPVHFERIDELFDFLVEHLANLIDTRVQAGLYRSYIDREENMRAVRGRILIGEDARRNAVMRHRTYCQFSEFTWDVPENRVIRQTVYAMSRIVRNPTLQRRLATLDRTLGEIDPAPLPLSTFDSFHYHRLNDDYRPIHRLCRLLLEGSSVSEHAGQMGFRAFLLDMNRLFELFLSAALAQALPNSIALSAQHSSSLDRDGWVTIRPDLSLLRHGKPVLIADAKYKRDDDYLTSHADLYQVLSYCTAEAVDRGAIIYPKWGAAGELEVRIRNSPVSIRRLSVDLGGSVADVRLSVEQLAWRLAELANAKIEPPSTLPQAAG